MSRSSKSSAPTSRSNCSSRRAIRSGTPGSARSAPRRRSTWRGRCPGATRSADGAASTTHSCLRCISLCRQRAAASFPRLFGGSPWPAALLPPGLLPRRSKCSAMGAQLLLTHVATTSSLVSPVWRSRIAVFFGVLSLALSGARVGDVWAIDGIQGSETYRSEVVGRVGVVAAGRHFAAEAGMRMLARGGNAVDAGVAAVFAAAVTEISHFGLGGEAPLIIHLAERKETVVINGQGVAPAAASIDLFRGQHGIPANGPSAGTVPAVVDALAIALAEFGTLSLGETLAPAIALAGGFPWYGFLTRYLTPEVSQLQRFPSGARVYLQGPGGTVPAQGSVFRQPDLAQTFRSLLEEEQKNAAQGRKAAIYAARDRFYRGDIGQRIARAVQAAGGIMTEADLASYKGRIERPTRGAFTTRHGNFEVFKTGFWGQGPVLLQTL